MTPLLLILAGALSLMATIGAAIAVALLTTEARGNVPVLCHRLLDRTAARLPAEMQDRREEWESELDDAVGRPITQMVIAVRIWRDGRALAQEATAGLVETESSQVGRKKGRVAGLTTLLVLLERPFAAGRRIGALLDIGITRALVTVGFVAMVNLLATLLFSSSLTRDLIVLVGIPVILIFILIFVLRLSRK